MLLKNIQTKIILSLFFAFAFLLFPKFALASTLYLSPGSGNIPVGGVVSFQVRLNTGGEGVNAVSAFLSYPADKLDVAWVSPTGTFGIEAERSFGGGIIKISRGNLSPVSGNVSVATIGFRGKTEGSATVAFIGGSSAPRASDSSDSLNLGGSGGAVMRIVKGVPAAPKQGTLGAQQKDNLGPKISGITVSAVSTNSATIAWKTDEKADSYVEYGLESGQYFLNASNGNLVTDRSLTLEGPALLAGTKFYFHVKSKDELGNLTTSEEATFQLSGYTVRIRIVDDKNNPVAGQEVTLYSDPIKGVTDTNGEVVFNNVAAGKHVAVVKIGQTEKTTEVNVTSSLQPQNVTVMVSAVKENKALSLANLPIPPLYLVFGAGGILLIVFVTVIILRLRKKKSPIKISNNNNPLTNISNIPQPIPQPQVISPAPVPPTVPTTSPSLAYPPNIPNTNTQAPPAITPMQVGSTTIQSESVPTQSGSDSIGSGSVPTESGPVTNPTPVGNGTTNNPWGSNSS